jgi:hypothetical protein
LQADPVRAVAGGRDRPDAAGPRNADCGLAVLDVKSGQAEADGEPLLRVQSAGLAVHEGEAAAGDVLHQTGKESLRDVRTKPNQAAVREPLFVPFPSIVIHRRFPRSFPTL